MIDLRLSLDDTDFNTLVKTARATIAAQSPAWTDHNIHDPGIMLSELMAWVADAQIYSLSRTRRDERLAYARLLGLRPHGPTPAYGLIWPLEGDEGSAGGMTSMSISQGTNVLAEMPEIPRFRTMFNQQLSPATITSVVSTGADGTEADHNRINHHNGATYLPFAASPGLTTLLTLGFKGSSIAPGGTGAFVLGVEVNGVPSPNLPDTLKDHPAFDITFRDGSDSRRIALLKDTTRGFMRSGILRLDIALDKQDVAANDHMQLVDISHLGFKLIFRRRRSGSLRMPRNLRTASNTLSVIQQEDVSEEISEFGQARPAQIYQLGCAGRYDLPSLSVEVGGKAWDIIDDLAAVDLDNCVVTVD